MLEAIGTRSTREKATEHLNSAIAAAPEMAPAYTLLAEMHLRRANARVDAKTISATVQELLDRAASIDPDLPELHFVKARFASLIQWNWAAADAGFQRSLALSPGTSRYRSDYGMHLSLTGRHEQAIRQMEMAAEADPLRLLNKSILARFLYLARKYNEAIEVSRQVLEIDSRADDGWVIIGLSLLAQGKIKEAIQAIENARTTKINFLALIGHAYGISGRKEEARAILNQLEAESRKQYVQPSILARIHLGLGDFEKVDALMERAFDERDWWLTFCVQDPRFDVVRHRPRFQAVVEKLNLPASVLH